MTEHDPAATFQADQAAAKEEYQTREELVFQSQLRNTNAHAALEEGEAWRLTAIAGAVIAATDMTKAAFSLLVLRAAFRLVFRR